MNVDKYCHYWVLAGLFLVLAILTFKPIEDDLLMHIKVGERICTHGLQQEDPFCFTTDKNSKPWVAHLWLSQVVFYIIDSTWGLLAIRIFLSFMVVVFAGSVYYFYRVMGFSPLAAVVGICMVSVLAIDRFRARPHIFSMIFLYWGLGFVLRPGKRFGTLDYLIVFATSTLAINLHSGAILFPVVLTIWTASHILQSIYDKRPYARQLVYIAIIAWLAMLCTPYHYKMLVYIISPKPLLPHIPEWHGSWHYFAYWDRVLLATMPYIVASLLLMRYRWQPALPEIITMLPLLYLGWRHNRFLFLLGIPLGMIGPYFWQRLITRKWLWWVIAITLFVNFCVVRTPKTWYAIQNVQEHLKRERFPIGARKFLQSAAIRGNILTYPRWASYLNYYLAKNCKTFMDTRHIYTGANIYRDFWKIYRGLPVQSQLLRYYRVNILVVDNSFAFHANEMRAWKLVYGDDQAAVLLRIAR